MNTCSTPSGQGQSGAADFAKRAVDSVQGGGYIAPHDIAQMAELVDALVSGTSAARRGGSSPLLGTITFESRATRSGCSAFVVLAGPVGQIISRSSGCARSASEMTAGAAGQRMPIAGSSQRIPLPWPGT